jgi:hypothetical protein
MQGSRCPPRARRGHRRMERNWIAWTMLHALRVTPTEPAWKNVAALTSRRPKGRDR